MIIVNTLIVYRILRVIGICANGLAFGCIIKVPIVILGKTEMFVHIVEVKVLKSEINNYR